MKITDCLNILTKREKLGFLFYFIIFYISYFFEMLGIGLLLPLLSKDNLSNVSTDIPILNNLFNFFEKFNTSEILIIMVVLIILKNTFLIFANFFNQFLYYKVNTRLANIVFAHYLNIDYEKLLKKKVHTINRKVTFELPIFVDYLVRNVDFFSFFSLLLIYGIFGAVIFIEATYIFLPIIIILILISKLIFKKKLKEYGKQRVNADDSINNAIIEFLPGLREILVYRLKSKIIKKFFIEISNKFKVILKLNFLTKNNKNIFELLVAVLILIFFFIFFKENKFVQEDYLPLLIFFVALFTRSMPVLAELFSIRQRINFASASANQTIKELKSIKNNLRKLSTSKLNYKNLSTLELKNLNFSYDKNNIVFKNLNFKVEIWSNKVLLIYGKNGSGKSTFIDLISGVLRPHSGKLLCDNKFINFEDLKEITTLAPQDTLLFNGSIKKNITMNFFTDNNFVIKDRLSKSIEFAGLGNFINTFKNKIEHHISDGGKNLSGGQKQRIGLARALYKDSKIIIFDEPTNNLDLKGKNNFIKNISKLSKEKKIIIITHDLGLKKMNSISYEIINKKIVKIDD